MPFAEAFEKKFKQFLPSPFSIALVLTAIAFISSFLFITSQSAETGSTILKITDYWYHGLWNASLMTFAMQMMLMLVLGHVLALSKPVNHFINTATKKINNNASAAFWVTLLTIIVSLFNWGLGLIFGAIFARKIGERSLKNGVKINYPLIGAAGYSGLMVWHGGLSGSAPVKANEAGHLHQITSGLISNKQALELPDLIPITETTFGSMNSVTTIVLLIAIPALMFFIGKRIKPKKYTLPTQIQKVIIQDKPIGAERIDASFVIGKLVGGFILFYSIYLAWSNTGQSLSFLTPNYINFSLLGLALLMHKNIKTFIEAVEDAIGGAAGILIQFPLYFGIMGIMKDSGLVELMSEVLIANSNQTTFSIYTFISSGIVNIFVPSGGGQWAVQAPILLQTALELKVPLSKAVMSLAYGDQLTNMLQPFWALPLLGITGLKAKEILPYTLIMMLIGAIIFMTSLLLF